MSIKFWNILLVLALLAALSGGGYILYQNHQQQLAEQAAEQARLEAEKKAQAEALAKGFEDALNGFLKDLDDQAQEYKKRRKVLLSLIKPENLRAAEYIEENKNLGESTSMALQLQMESIIGLFDKTDENLTGLISRLPDGHAENANASWRTIREEQLNDYIQFFESEQAVISKLQELLNFYDEHKADMKVDLERDRIVFSNIETQAQAFEITTELKELIKDRKQPSDR